MERRKTCRRCNIEWVGDDVDLLFKVDPRVTGHGRLPRCLGSVCRLCLTTARDEEKQNNRWIPKVRRTLRHHAEKAIRDGDVASTAEFVAKYQWNVTDMARDAEHAYAHRCPYCNRRYDGMGNGPRDITLDVINPDEKPYYRTNCKFACGSCNSSKGAMSPQRWSALLAAWARWESERREPPKQLTLEI